MANSNSDNVNLLNKVGKISDNYKNLPQKNIARSTCKIEYNIENTKYTGKGFLLLLPVPDLEHTIRGLITTNKILDNSILYNSEISLYFSTNETKLSLIPKNHFCFSDPFLDITFIELKNPEFDGFNFLTVDENIIKSGYVYIIKDSKGENISQGKINRRWGFTLEHTISVDENSSGNALISLETNKVIGVLNKRKAKDKNNNIFSCATSIEAAILGIKILYNSYKYNKSAFEEKENGFVQKEIKSLNNIEINELKIYGLKTTSNSEIFISPASPFVTPLWFYRTNYAWYWTPTKPEDNYPEEVNWIIIYPGCSLKVIGGPYDGYEPAERNIILIHWLESTGLSYLA